VVGAVASLPDNAQTLQVGDDILAINGADTPDLTSFAEVARALPSSARVEYTILRDGTVQIISGPQPFPAMIGSIGLQSAAQDAGLAVGDVVLSINDTPVYAFSDMVAYVKNSKDTPLSLKIWRPETGGQGAEVMETTLIPRKSLTPKADGGFEERYLIGLGEGLVFTPELYTPGPIETLILGVERTWSLITTNLSGIMHLVTGKVSSCYMSGPIGIAKVSSAAASQGGLTFVMMIAGLSTAVGLMNLFPIPVLDGGHLVFHVYEAVTGKPPSDSVLRILMTIGLLLLLSLMAFALGNDLFCP
jgi:regulator of sigma E protease